MGLFKKIGSFFGLGSDEPSGPSNAVSGRGGLMPKMGSTQNRAEALGQRGLPQRGPGRNEPPAQRRPSSPLDRLLYEGEWVSVTSSNLDMIAYDPKLNGGTLKVIFKDQNEYAVWPVSVEEMTSLYAAGSKGKWYWRNVRILGTKLGHKKNYVHVAGHGAMQRKWIETPEQVVRHLEQVEEESEYFNLYGKPKAAPMVRGVLPESIPLNFFLTEPPTPGPGKNLTGQ